MKYLNTNNLKTETKVGAGIYLKDFFFLIGYIGFSYMIRGTVHSDIRWLYMIFSIIVALILTLPSSFNKKRRNYQSVFIYFRRDNSLYKSISIKKKK